MKLKKIHLFFGALALLGEISLGSLNWAEAMKITPALESNPKDKEMREKTSAEVMEAIDRYIPQPDHPIDKPFLMPIDHVFSIEGHGTVVTGRVERGLVKPGDDVEIVWSDKTVNATISRVEGNQKLLAQGEAGDMVEVLLKGTKAEDVKRGQVLAAPGSIKPHTKFEAEAYFLTKEEGGRAKPFFTSNRPQFYFRTTDVTGSVTLPEDVEMVIPGDNVTMNVELTSPIVMDTGLRFAIREGNRTVGVGTVSKIIE